MPAATELLLGLWLRRMKRSKCERTVTDFRRDLISRGGAANDNITDDERAARLTLLASIENVCRGCPRMCPMHPEMERQRVI